MGHLSAIVLSVALPMGGLALFLRRKAHPLVVAGLAQGSLVGVAVAVCSSDRFSRRTAGLLGKRRDGKFKWWSIPVFWPYFVGLQLKLRVQRLISHEPLNNEVAPGLYIGGWPDRPENLPWEPRNLAVIDVTSELYRGHYEGPYLNLPTWDTTGVDPRYIEEGVQWAKVQLARGHRLLVHCAHGHGRSAAVLAAVLMETGRAQTIDEAVAMMQRTRPLVRLNRAHRQSVEDWMALRSTVTGGDPEGMSLGRKFNDGQPIGSSGTHLGAPSRDL